MTDDVERLLEQFSREVRKRTSYQGEQDHRIVERRAFADALEACGLEVNKAGTREFVRDMRDKLEGVTNIALDELRKSPSPAVALRCQQVIDTFLRDKHRAATLSDTEGK